MKPPKKGFFSPRNPHKYKGNPTQIVYRSGLELKVMLYLDKHPDVISWSSEEIIVPYRCKTDSRIHRYFPDFVIEMNKKGKKEIMMVEVKPHSQTLPPKKSTKKKQKTFITEVMTYAKNHSKWESARKFCESRGWKFQIITEKDIHG